MRGSADRQMAMLTTLSTEDLIPADHPIRRIRVVVDAVLGSMDATFTAMYSTRGRPSVPPEVLLKATVLMAMYSIRSERAFCERLNYDLLFKWFLDMRIDEPAFDATTFSENRQRLLDHEIADEFFAAVVTQAKLRRYVSSEHFSVDGMLLEAWASHKSFKPKNDSDGPDRCGGVDAPGPQGRNAEADWKGQKRSNDTHASTTAREARLFPKGLKDRRRWPQTPRQGPRTQPGLVQDRHRRLQRHPHLRPRRRHHLSAVAARHPAPSTFGGSTTESGVTTPNVAAPRQRSEDQPPERGPQRRTSVNGSLGQQHRRPFQHPVRRSSGCQGVAGGGFSRVRKSWRAM